MGQFHPGSMDANTYRFVGAVASLCALKKITLRLVAQPRVRIDGDYGSGFFNERQLVVATGVPDWLGVLVHESSHVDQYIEGSRLWTEVDPHLIAVNSWLADTSKGRKIRNKLESFKCVLALELDAERRSLKKIARYSLPIEKKVYAQKANSYLFGYTQAMRSRRWFPEAYTYPEIWKRMPGKLLSLESYLDPKSPFVKYYNFSLLEK